MGGERAEATRNPGGAAGRRARAEGAERTRAWLPIWQPCLLAGSVG